MGLGGIKKGQNAPYSFIAQRGGRKKPSLLLFLLFLCIYLLNKSDICYY